jgi:mRNA-degrading endonuclease RelE of RelBE toxin-antitoxin system
MSPKRRDRVAPPPVEPEWEVRFGSSEAAKDWDGLCVHARTRTREAFELMRSNPRPVEDATHYRLRGDLSTRTFGGRELELWQIKVSSSGRIWYLPDDDEHTVWVIKASPAHPKETD